MHDLAEEDLEAAAERGLLLTCDDGAPDQEWSGREQDRHEGRSGKIADKCCELFAGKLALPVRLQGIGREMKGFGQIRQDFLFSAICGFVAQSSTTFEISTVGAGYFSFMPSRAWTINSATTWLRNHFLFAGITYQGARSVLHFR